MPSINPFIKPIIHNLRIVSIPYFSAVLLFYILDQHRRKSQNALLYTFQKFLLWTHCKGMLCKTEKTDLKKILLNVNILSILIGLILFLFHIRFPYGIQDTLNKMSNMAGPLGMLLAGMVGLFETFIG